jgi:hypothetical protein
LRVECELRHIGDKNGEWNTIIESTFDVGAHFRCTMRVDRGQIDPATVIRPVPAEWRPHMPERLDESTQAPCLCHY